MVKRQDFAPEVSAFGTKPAGEALEKHCLQLLLQHSKLDDCGRAFPSASLSSRTRTVPKDLLLKGMDQQIAVLGKAVEKAAEENEKSRLLMTQPGVGPITSLAFVLTVGNAERFERGKQVASYLGLVGPLNPASPLARTGVQSCCSIPSNLPSRR
jgi:hypothetical protein